MQDLLQDASYPATLIDGDRDNALELTKASQPEIEAMERVAILTKPFAIADLYRVLRELGAAAD